jgi:osmotically-inducible protein OsmY
MGTSLLWQTDGQLHEAVQRQLDWEPNINAEEIALLASDGVITLIGFVNTYGEKLAAEQAVKRVRGVRAVANDIHVRLLNERSDPDIAKDVVHALQSHTEVPRSVTVTVRDGLVTLDGTVEWNYQRTAAESAVRHLKGVKGVSNAIYIEPVASPGQVQTLI